MPTSPIDFDAHLAGQSDAFLEAMLRADPAARVPGCPDWSADDLLSHLMRVQDFWAHVLAVRPAPPEDYVEPDRPTDREALAERFRDASRRLRGQLRSARDEEAAWTWHHSNHTVGFIRRRQAHEALIHRLDAEQAAGADDLTVLPADLAADGVLEVLDWMYGGAPDWGSFTADGAHVALEALDTGDRVVVALGRFAGTPPDADEPIDEDDVRIADPAMPAEATVTAPAAALDAWLWQRADDAVVTWSGDPAARARLERVVRQPIT